MSLVTLRLEQITKTFYDGAAPIPALENCTFAIGGGTFTCLIGPSGSGKSTIFNLITGLIRPDQGAIWLGEERIDGVPGRVGYMPQRDLLLPWRTVLGNATLGAEIAGVDKNTARQQARELLPRFGLAGFAEAYPARLSGGMRQRAALLRTYLIGRSVLLLDEPFGALDALTRREMQRWLLGVWAEMGTTILFITHDVTEAVTLADRVLVLTTRPGRIKADIPITLPRPREEGSAAFVSAQVGVYQALIGG
ncbi:MAG TPA: ABC transporter ATP-binding protein [Aggregatilineales bacterium]|nr:ABC transporter ATP-binding protein [Aggregatilineales bacterium]